MKTKKILVEHCKLRIFEDGTYINIYDHSRVSKWKLKDNKFYYKHDYMSEFSENRDNDCEELLAKIINRLFEIEALE